jgi:hypothetical protein
MVVADKGAPASRPFSIAMNRTDKDQHASLFGPPSELINIAAFLRAVSDDKEEVSAEKTSIAGWTEWIELSEQRRQEIEDECRWVFSFTIRTTSNEANSTALPTFRVR